MSVKGDIQGMEHTVKVWIIPLYKNTAVCVTISRPHTVRICRLSVSQRELAVSNKYGLITNVTVEKLLLHIR